MRNQRSLLISILFLFLSGCATMKVAREVQSGRGALRVGNPKDAVSHFQAAAELNPDYVANYSTLEVGIWTYLGRAYYEAGEKEKALEALKRARKEEGGDNFARLYLGLVMSENGSRDAGKRELEAGLMGLHQWLETVSGRVIHGHYWDPGRDLRKSIVQTLDLLKEKEIPWPQVVANVRQLGAKFDEEPERAREDRRQDLNSGHRDSKP